MKKILREKALENPEGLKTFFHMFYILMMNSSSEVEYMQETSYHEFNDNQHSNEA